eukprot:jgi/Picsp_1/3195/NSC_06035-R1_protein
MMRIVAILLRSTLTVWLQGRGRAVDFKSYADGPSSKQISKYTETQFLGFGVHTGGAPWLLPPYFANSSCQEQAAEGWPSIAQQIRRGEWDDCLVMNPECRGKDAGVSTSLITMLQKETLPPIILASLSCYLGNSNDERKDVAGRLEIMKEAVEAAYMKSNTSEDVLKIFIAPEFFFRGPDGAYPWFEIELHTHLQRGVRGEVLHPIAAIGEGLKRIAHNATYKDWLFVFGTVVAMDVEEDGAVTDPRVIAGNPTPGSFRFYNFAPILRGTDPDDPTKHHESTMLLAPKVYVSGIDFLTSGRNPYSNELPSSIYDNQDWKDFEAELSARYGFTMLYDNIFEIEGILMSIEICLDHQKRMTLASFLEWSEQPESVRIPMIFNSERRSKDCAQSQNNANDLCFYRQEAPKSLPQISLITSAGTRLSRDSFVFGLNGSIYLQDGLDVFAADAATCSDVLIDERSGHLVYDGCSRPKGRVSPVSDRMNSLVQGYFSTQGLGGDGLPTITVYEPMSIPVDKGFPPRICPVDIDRGCSCDKPLWNARNQTCRDIRIQ